MIKPCETHSERADVRPTILRKQIAIRCSNNTAVLHTIVPVKSHGLAVFRHTHSDRIVLVVAKKAHAKRPERHDLSPRARSEQAVDVGVDVDVVVVLVDELGQLTDLM